MLSSEPKPVTIMVDDVLRVSGLLQAPPRHELVSSSRMARALE